MRKLFPLRRRKSPVAPPERVPEVSVTAGTRSVLDMVSPPGFFVGRRDVEVGPDRFVRVYYMAGTPRKVWVGWLSELQGLGDVDLSVHVFPIPNREAIRDLTREITNAGTVLELSQRAGSVGEQVTVAASKVGDALALRERLTSGETRVFSVVVLVTVAASTRKELEYRCSLLEEVMGGRDVHLLPAFLRQGEALRSSLPLGSCALWDQQFVFDSGAVRTLIPFTSADLAHPDGVLLGVNYHTGGPVFFDCFAVPPLFNHNVGVFAVAGAGKSFLIKLMSARSALQGVRTVFIDPEGEYRMLAEALGGRCVRLDARDPLVNPFDLELEETEQGPALDLAEKVQELKGLVTAVLETYGRGQRLDPHEAALLERAIRAEYEARGITSDPATLYERAGEGFGLSKKEMPTFSSLHARLGGMGRDAARLCALLEPCLAGGSLGMFDGQSRVRLGEEPLLAFDVSGLEETYVRPVAMHFLLEWTWEKFVKGFWGQKKRVVVDEAWLFMGHPETAQFLQTMARRGRKRRCSFVVASQHWREFSESAAGQAVLTNMASLVLMRQNPVDLEPARETFRLTEGEAAFLAGCDRGECLLRAGSDAVALRVVAADLERELMESVVQQR